ncbi:hypothetical protein PUN28_018281 [Cardiocondyla obscurior]|uniref:Uncharacterized protein n=1 Tax=Cardiocondyla obscurior TaxID=286306 RepID=A0AAW2EKJ4_9HYME
MRPSAYTHLSRGRVCEQDYGVQRGGTCRKVIKRPAARAAGHSARSRRAASQFRQENARRNDEIYSTSRRLPGFLTRHARRNDRFCCN